jgi:hypothetical protein
MAMIAPNETTDAAPPERGCKGIVFLAGAIKYWWLRVCTCCKTIEGEETHNCFTCGAPTEELWGGPEHKEYVNYRDYIRRLLVQEGYLVYAPHEAFKGTWDERAQAVNDAGIAAADVVMNLSPFGIPTEGTDAEVAYARRVGTPVIHHPPMEMFQAEIDLLLRKIQLTIGV